MSCHMDLWYSFPIAKHCPLKQGLRLSFELGDFLFHILQNTLCCKKNCNPCFCTHVPSQPTRDIYLLFNLCYFIHSTQLHRLYWSYFTTSEQCLVVAGLLSGYKISTKRSQNHLVLTSNFLNIMSEKKPRHSCLECQISIIEYAE